MFNFRFPYRGGYIVIPYNTDCKNSVFFDTKKINLKNFGFFFEGCKVGCEIGRELNTVGTFFHGSDGREVTGREFRLYSPHNLRRILCGFTALRRGGNWYCVRRFLPVAEGLAPSRL